MCLGSHDVALVFDSLLLEAAAKAAVFVCARMSAKQGKTAGLCRTKGYLLVPFGITMCLR